jgi:hypothetical protein
MNDTQRTRLLAGILAATVAVFLGRSGFNSFVTGPISRSEKALVSAAEDLEKQELKEIGLLVARKNLDDWRAISLPENALNAQRLYREWVESLALQCGFGSLEVEPGRRPDRSGKYLSVTVDVKAETDLAGLSRFLYVFDQSSLLHRVVDLNIKSTGSQGNPRLEISLTAEGISVVNSGERPELFARTQTVSEVDGAATQIEVRRTEAFPWKESFLIRMERELLKVVSADEASETLWQVERGILNTTAESHPADTVVELLPVLWDRREKQFDQYTALLNASPFAVPAPPRTWNPRIAGLSSQTIAPGDTVRQTARADDVNPELGAAVLTLEESAPGMTLESSTGQLTWQTENTLATGVYPVKIVMTQPGAPEVRSETRIMITVKIPNNPPELSVPEKANVVLGQKFQLALTATDDGGADQLTWSLAAGAPEGLEIDAKTGVLSWSPPNTFKPADYSVTVNVSDKGDAPLTSSGTLSLAVQDDAAIMLLLTGAVSKDDVWYAWFRNKATGDRQQLKVGEHLKVAEIDATLTAIEPRSIQFTDVQGTWTLQLGETVRQKRLAVTAEAKSDAEESASEKTSGPAPAAGE